MIWLTLDALDKMLNDMSDGMHVYDYLDKYKSVKCEIHGLAPNDKFEKYVSNNGMKTRICGNIDKNNHVRLSNFTCTCLNELGSVWARPNKTDYVIGASNRRLLEKFVNEHYDILVYYYAYRRFNDTDFDQTLL